VKRKAAGKARTVARHHAHVKPASAHGKGATGHAHKHHKAAKHHAAARKHKGTVARGLAPDAAQVASCAAEALAASLRHLQLPGLSVRDADVLDLFRRAGGNPDAGTPIVAVLEAAAEYGLAGVRPAWFAQQEDKDSGSRQAEGQTAETAQPWPGNLGFCFSRSRHTLRAQINTGLILGVDLPGPHTVLATPEGWWSWGELYCPWCEWPDAVIEEAWLVTWPASDDQGREVMSYAS
jgi:hypothetical protein